MSKGTPMLTVRCPPELREQARATARDRGETMTDAVQAGLRLYIAARSVPARRPACEFEPQKGSPLRCDRCGGRKADHR